MTITKLPLRLLTIGETAERLGVSKSSVYRLIREKELRVVDVAASGKTARTRIREDDLTAFIEKRTAATETPTTEDALAASS